METQEHGAVPRGTPPLRQSLFEPPIPDNEYAPFRPALPAYPGDPTTRQRNAAQLADLLASRNADELRTLLGSIPGLQAALEQSRSERAPSSIASLARGLNTTNSGSAQADMIAAVAAAAAAATAAALGQRSSSLDVGAVAEGSKRSVQSPRKTPRKSGVHNNNAMLVGLGEPIVPRVVTPLNARHLVGARVRSEMDEPETADGNTGAGEPWVTAQGIVGGAGASASASASASVGDNYAMNDTDAPMLIQDDSADDNDGIEELVDTSATADSAGVLPSAAYGTNGQSGAVPPFTQRLKGAQVSVFQRLAAGKPCNVKWTSWLHSVFLEEDRVIFTFTVVFCLCAVLSMIAIGVLVSGNQRTRTSNNDSDTTDDWDNSRRNRKVRRQLRVDNPDRPLNSVGAPLQKPVASAAQRRLAYDDSVDNAAEFEYDADPPAAAEAEAEGAGLQRRGRDTWATSGWSGSRSHGVSASRRTPQHMAPVRSVRSVRSTRSSRSERGYGSY